MSSITELMIKLRSLLGKAPFSDELIELKNKLDIVDLVYTNLNLEGSILTKAGVMNILEGNVINNVPIKEHLLIEIHNRLLARMEDRIEMKYEVDIAVVEDFYSIIISGNSVKYRSTSPELYHLDFVPGDYSDIRSALSDELKQVGRTDFDGNFCMKAAAYHNKIIKVYPFEEYNEILARTIMQYELMRNGLFPIQLDVKEQEYNSIVSQSISMNDNGPFADIIINSAMEKVELLLEKA